VADQGDGSRQVRCRAASLSVGWPHLQTARRAKPFQLSRPAFQSGWPLPCHDRRASLHTWPVPIRSRTRQGLHRQTQPSASSRRCEHECDCRSPSASSPRRHTVSKTDVGPAPARLIVSPLCDPRTPCRGWQAEGLPRSRCRAPCRQGPRVGKRRVFRGDARVLQREG
jgi:hypothetical protein